VRIGSPLTAPSAAPAFVARSGWRAGETTDRAGQHVAHVLDAAHTPGVGPALILPTEGENIILIGPPAP
jgi:hypothetical protein